MGTSPTVSEWLISPWGGVAYLDLRGGELTFDDAERLLEVVQFYYSNRRVSLLIIDVRGREPLPGPVHFVPQRVLKVELETESRRHIDQRANRGAQSGVSLVADDTEPHQTARR